MDKTLHSTLLELRDHEGKELAEFLRLVTEKAARALSVERASIWLFNQDQSAIELCDLFVSSAGTHEAGASLEAVDYPGYFDAIDSHDSILADDAHTHPATREFSESYLTPFGIWSMLDVPIRVGDQLFGVICLEHCGSARKWKSEENDFAVAAASYVTVAIEQDQRKSAQTELELFRALLDRVNDTIEVIDPATGRFLDVNDCGCRQLGYSREEILQLTVPDINPQVDSNTFAAHAAETRTMGTVTMETVHRRKDGSIFPCEISLSSARIGRDYLVAIVRDITERKKQEQLRRESAERHRVIFHACRDAMMTLSPPSWNFSSCNPAAVELFGVTDEAEFCSLGPWQLSPENQPDGTASSEKAQTMISEAMRTGSQFFEWTHARKDGSSFLATVLLSRVEIAGEVFLEATVRDVTAQKEAEAELLRLNENLEHIVTERTSELKASERNYREIFNAVNDAVFVHDAETGAILDVNDSTLMLYGYSPEEMLRQGPDDCSEGTSPYSAKEAREWLQKTIAEGPQVFEWRARRRGGGLFWVEVSLKCAVINGRQRILAVVRDITERRQSAESLRAAELRLRQAATAGNVGLWDWDLRTNKVFFSPEWKRQIGYSDHELKGDFEEWRSRLHPDDVDLAMQAVNDFMEGRSPRYEVEFRLCHKDGSYRWILSKGSILTDESGEQLRMLGSHVDITERKQNEQQQLRSNSLLTATLESTADGILVVDGEARVRNFNRRFLDLWRMPAALAKDGRDEEFLEQVVDQLVDPEGFLERVKELHAKPEANSWDELEFNDGRSFECYSQPQLLDGKVAGRVWSFRDVTERRHAEMALSESESRFRRLFEDSAEAILLIENGRFIDCNASALAMLRMNDVAEVRNVPPAALSPEMQPDGRPSAEKATEMIDKAYAEGSNLFEWEHLRGDGESFIAEVLLTPIRYPDRHLLHVVWRDITGRKRAQEALRAAESRLRQAVSAANVGLWDWDLLTNEVYFSPEWKRQIGYDVHEIGSGFEEWRSRLHPEDLSVSLEAVDEFRAGRRPKFEIEFRLRHKDGGWRWILASGSILADEAGRQLRMLGTHLDITERKSIETQMLRKQRLESIGTLAGGIAHDLNNTLTPIVMVADELREEYPEEQDLVGLVDANARRAADMVKQLLTFARGIEGERQEIRTRLVFREIENIVESTFPKNIELHIQCPDHLHLLLGDSTQLHQILLNLCVNARDAMPAGGTITLGAENVEIDQSEVPEAIPGPYVRWWIRDTGEGIAPENLNQIFDPFFSTKGADGTGLGLSTAVGIVKSHDGFVRVESTLGTGTMVAVHLPAATGRARDGAEPEDSVNFRGEGETILVVDDEATVRRAACRVLKRLNFNPLEASSGVEGLKLAREHGAELDAVLSDLHMPGMDGLEFVRELRKNLPDIPVAVASGLMNDESAASFEALNVTVRMDKPYSKSQLMKALQAILGSPDAG